MHNALSIFFLYLHSLFYKIQYINVCISPNQRIYTRSLIELFTVFYIFAFDTLSFVFYNNICNVFYIPRHIFVHMEAAVQSQPRKHCVFL